MSTPARRASIAFVIAAGCVGCAGGAPAPASVASGAREVHFSLPTDGGDLVNLPLAGSRAVIDVWGITCPPCREAVPALVARNAELETAGAKLVLVAVLADGETTDGARAALASWGVSRPFLVDRGDVLRREADVTALPSTLIVSSSGAVLWVAPRGATADDIVAAARAIR